MANEPSDISGSSLQELLVGAIFTIKEDDREAALELYLQYLTDEGLKETLFALMKMFERSTEADAGTVLAAKTLVAWEEVYDLREMTNLFFQRFIVQWAGVFLRGGGGFEAEKAFSFVGTLLEMNAQRMYPFDLSDLREILRQKLPVGPFWARRVIQLFQFLAPFGVLGEDLKFEGEMSSNCRNALMILVREVVDELRREGRYGLASALLTTLTDAPFRELEPLYRLALDGRQAIPVSEWRFPEIAAQLCVPAELPMYPQALYESLTSPLGDARPVAIMLRGEEGSESMPLPLRANDPRALRGLVERTALGRWGEVVALSASSYSGRVCGGNMTMPMFHFVCALLGMYKATEDRRFGIAAALGQKVLEQLGDSEVLVTRLVRFYCESGIALQEIEDRIAYMRGARAVFPEESDLDLPRVEYSRPAPPELLEQERAIRQRFDAQCRALYEQVGVDARDALDRALKEASPLRLI